eukprot:SAG31_NODE_4342_length_3337_cov_1.899012_3_plen_555_part_00
MQYDVDLETIADGTSARAAFEVDFKTVVAGFVSSIDAENVTINSISAGSVVDYTIMLNAFAADATAVFTTLQTVPVSDFTIAVGSHARATAITPPAMHEVIHGRAIQISESEWGRGGGWRTVWRGRSARIIDCNFTDRRQIPADFDFTGRASANQAGSNSLDETLDLDPALVKLHCRDNESSVSDERSPSCFSVNDGQTSNLEISGSRFENVTNRAISISVGTVTATISNCQFIGCTHYVSARQAWDTPAGGAILVRQRQAFDNQTSTPFAVQIISSQFERNYVLPVTNGDLSPYLPHGQINGALYGGGAIFLYGDAASAGGSVAVTRCAFVKNAVPGVGTQERSGEAANVPFGDGINWPQDCRVPPCPYLVPAVQAIDVVWKSKGGAIAILGMVVNITSSSFSGNFATKGSDVHVMFASFTVLSCSFTKYETPQMIFGQVEEPRLFKFFNHSAFMLAREFMKVSFADYSTRPHFIASHTNLWKHFLIRAGMYIVGDSPTTFDVRNTTFEPYVEKAIRDTGVSHDNATSGIYLVPESVTASILGGCEQVRMHIH